MTETTIRISEETKERLDYMKDKYNKEKGTVVKWSYEDIIKQLIIDNLSS